MSVESSEEHKAVGHCGELDPLINALIAPHILNAVNNKGTI